MNTERETDGGSYLEYNRIEGLYSSHSEEMCIITASVQCKKMDDMNELLEGLFDLRDARVLLHHQEIGLPVLVEFADATEQEARARILVPNNGDQFPAAGHREAPSDAGFVKRGDKLQLADEG